MTNDEGMTEIRILGKFAARLCHLIIRASFVICHSCFVIIDQCRVVRVHFVVRFRKFPTILVLILMAACVSIGQTPSGAETGIEGVITISPIKPGPIRPDTPDSQPLADAAFVVENEKGQVASFTTDNQGRFRTSLAPGHYKVSMEGKTRGIRHFGPFEVDVEPGKMTKVQWECDSGIR
jgi:hypothetical protein